MTTVSPSDAPRPDVDRLVELVATVESTQRAEDVDGFVALFHDDAVWVTGGGVRLVGKEAIAAFTRSVLPGAMVGVTVDYVGRPRPLPDARRRPDGGRPGVPAARTAARRRVGCRATSGSARPAAAGSSRSARTPAVPA